MATMVELKRGRITADGLTVVVHGVGCLRAVIIEDGKEGGRVWKQLAIGRFVLPFPPPSAREVVTVDKGNPSSQVWAGGRYNRVSFI